MNLGRNVLWNLFAFTWLSLLLVAVIPYMVGRLGLQAFGIWSVLTAFVGYLAQVDLGLGNALIRFLAVEDEREDRTAFESILRSGLAVQLVLGTAVALLFFFLGPLLVERGGRVPPPLRAEAAAAFRLAAGSVFLAFPVAVFGSVPAALRRFDLVAARWAVFGSVQYGLFVLLLARGGGLVAVAGATLVSFVVVLGFLVGVSLRLRPGLRILPAWSPAAVRTLLRFGRFKFTAQVAVSLLQQLDRIVPRNNLLQIVERAQQPLPQQPTAHRRAGGVEHVEQRRLVGRPRIDRRHQLQVGRRGFIHQHVVGRVLHPQFPNMGKITP